MALRSTLFKSDAKLEAAAVSNSAHITPGAAGEHVRKLQYAVARLDGIPLEQDGTYGPKTAAAVLAYKKKRNIINRSYQSQADDIVGIMTMAALDQELFNLEQSAGPVKAIGCVIARRADPKDGPVG